MSDIRVRRRHSLLTRLVVTSLAIVMLAVSATAWLAVRTATNAIEHDQGQSLSQDKALYDELSTYSATHRDWSGVAPLVHAASAKLKRRITLTTTRRQVLAESGKGQAIDTANPLATIDALHPDPALADESSVIDARIVGPYRLSAKESSAARRFAQGVVGCLAKFGMVGQVVETPSGHPRVTTAVETNSKDRLGICTNVYRMHSFPTERTAIRNLVRPTADCAGVSSNRVSVRMDWDVSPPAFTALQSTDDVRSATRARGTENPRLTSCLEDARRAQLQPYTAPAALLFVTGANSSRTHATFTLSRRNVEQIVFVTGGVLLAAIAITVLLSRRLIKPLRVLADGAAAQQPVAVGRRDEIGRLAGALNEATRRRDEAEAQRRAMVGDAAHELRNPLTSMRSWLEAAQDGLTPVDAALVDLLHEETAVLQHILDDLADLAAADAGTLRLHVEPIDAVDCLVHAVDAATGAADAAGIALHVRARGTITMRADPIRVRQLVGNLLLNAIRYTPAGGEVEVSATVNGADAVVEVADTGIGIEPGHLARVFDRFWRADDSRTRATGGSGLGLAIVRQLVQAHGGSVDVASEPGRGTRFTVRLPLAGPHRA